jgi:phosphopantetheine--protein transferase-like protein
VLNKYSIVIIRLGADRKVYLSGNNPKSDRKTESGYFGIFTITSCSAIMQGTSPLHKPADSQQPEGEGENIDELNLWLAPSDHFTDSDAFKREILAGFCGLSAAEISFSVGEHGKPELEHAAIPCGFNISHSGDWVVCAVSTGADVGVDIEYLGRRQDILKLARRFYHPLESTLLEALPEEERPGFFFDLWTLKEASVKARGGALAPNLPEREFELLPRPGQHTIIKPLSTHPAQAFQCLFDPFPGYRIALCAHVPTLQTPRISLHISQSRGQWQETEFSLRACSEAQAGVDQP